MKRMTAMTRLSICLTAFILICSCLLPLCAAAQKIDFSDKKFEEPVNIEYWKSHPYDGIEIKRDTVWSYTWVVFHRPVSFWNATFDSTAYFREATFEDRASFGGTKFKSTAYFSLATFEDTTFFFGVTFDGTANFQRATFRSEAFFVISTFHSTSDFGKVRFDSTANFSGVTFGSMADFRWARFADDVWFVGATLPDKLDFRYVTDIAKEINFTWAKSPCSTCKCQIALVDSDISKIKLDMQLFELRFPSNPTYDKRCSVYEQMLKKLENDGFMDSYEILDIEYRQFKYDHKWYGSVVNALHKTWWNYGYDKERILFIWTPLFFIVFAFLNLLFWYGKLNDEVYTIEFLEKIPYVGGRTRTAMKKTLQVAAYTAVIFFGLKMDVSKFKKGVVRQHPWLFTYLMFVYVLGLVCLGFIVNIIFTR